MELAGHWSCSFSFHTELHPGSNWWPSKAANCNIWEGETRNFKKYTGPTLGPVHWIKLIIPVFPTHGLYLGWLSRYMACGMFLSLGVKMAFICTKTKNCTQYYSTGFPISQVDHHNVWSTCECWIGSLMITQLPKVMSEGCVGLAYWLQKSFR